MLSESAHLEHKTIGNPPLPPFLKHISRAVNINIATSCLAVAHTKEEKGFVLNALMETNIPNTIPKFSARISLQRFEMGLKRICPDKVPTVPEAIAA